MRFAWIRKNSAYHGSVKQSFSNRLTFIAYNVVWWIPIVLAFTKIVDYRTAFIAFFAFTIIRACVNLYRNNLLNPEQGESYPLRAV
jgi:hypothetical protein